MAGFDLRQEVRLFEAARNDGTPRRYFVDLWEGLRSHQIEPFGHDRAAFATNRLWEAFVFDAEGERCGHRVAQDVRESRLAGFEAGVRLQEANDAIDTTAFTAILGQITYSQLLDRLEAPQLVGRTLVTTRPATTAQKEIIPGIAPLRDMAEKIGEREDYPRIGTGTNYQLAPEKVKRGFIVDVTEEVMWEDRNGFIQEALDTGGDAMAVNWEKEIWDAALGVTTLYDRNGSGPQATYADSHTKGNFDNLDAATPLSDHLSIDKVLQGFDAQTDPDTGEPVLVAGQMQIVVPRALVMTLGTILNSTSVTVGADSAAVRTTIGNPIAFDKLRTFTPITSPYVKLRGGSDTTWWLGDFPGAFEYLEVWPPQMFTQGRDSHLAFENDVIMRLKARRKGAMSVRRPWRVRKVVAV